MSVNSIMIHGILDVTVDVAKRLDSKGVEYHAHNIRLIDNKGDVVTVTVFGPEHLEFLQHGLISDETLPPILKEQNS